MKYNPKIYSFVNPKLVPAKSSCLSFRLGMHKINAYRKKEGKVAFCFLF